MEKWGILKGVFMGEAFREREREGSCGGRGEREREREKCLCVWVFGMVREREKGLKDIVGGNAIGFTSYCCPSKGQVGPSLSL